MKIFLGLDPGKKGGLAALYSSGKAEAVPMPEDEEALFLWIATKAGTETYCCLEKVGGWIGGKKKKGGEEAESQGNPGSHMFNFGMNYGMLRAFCTGFLDKNNWQTVIPRTWQKRFVEAKGKDGDQRQHKRNLREKAKQLFPRIKVTLETADALLIARYCQEVYG